MSQQPYIGAPVTLISSLDVRYEGILFTIDPNESTVALQNVRCLGTEDRQPQGEKTIPKSDTVYEFIIFRGENIKSISLLEKAVEKAPIPDPAIVRVGAPEKKRPLQNRYRQPYENQYQRRRPPQQNWQPRQYQHRNYNRQPRRNYNRNRNYNRRPYNRDPQYAPGNGKFLSSRNNEDNVEAVKDDFDFVAANARFEKTAEKPQDKKEVEAGEEEEKEEKPSVTETEATEEQKAEENEAEPAEKKEPVVEEAAEEEQPQYQYKYNPDNFFDDLDDGKEMGKRKDLKARRALDTQTFGDIASSYSPKVYRRRRYRGNRNYRGGYRGGNRNYRDNRNQYQQRN